VSIDLVIFDCGGVLVDSEAIADGVVVSMLAELGLETTPAEARKRYGGQLLRDVVRLAERQLGEALPAGWAAEFERRRGEAMVRDLLPAPGAAIVLNALSSAGVDVCVASQGKPARTRLALATTQLLGFFDDDAIFSAEAVRRGKPHPDLFLHAADARSIEPSRCAVVEDAPPGITAALAAGMTAYGYSADGEDRWRLSKAGAKATLLSLEELPDLIGV
jgi:HAD superfamily hydrolase (TIGR01509 family)